MEFEPLEARLIADPAVDVLQALVDGLAGRNKLEPAVTVFLTDAVRSLGDRSSVGLHVPDRSPIEFDAVHLASLTGSRAASPPDTEGFVDGWLHAVDIETADIWSRLQSECVRLGRNVPARVETSALDRDARESAAAATVEHHITWPVNLHALDVNSDAIAYATLQYAMNTSDINGQRGKGNFPVPEEPAPAA